MFIPSPTNERRALTRDDSDGMKFIPTLTSFVDAQTCFVCVPMSLHGSPSLSHPLASEFRQRGHETRPVASEFRQHGAETRPCVHDLSWAPRPP